MIIRWHVGEKPETEGKYLVTVRDKSGEKFVHIGYHDTNSWTGYVLHDWEVLAWADMPMPMPFITNELGMFADAYQRLAARTINSDLSEYEQMMHALHGLAGEVGEIHSIFQKKYQGHPINDEHLIKEIGDLLWFIAELCTSLDVSIEEVMKKNIKKLIERYPEGFDAEHSLHRKDGDI